MYKGRPDIKLFNFILENSPFHKINKEKYKNSIKSFLQSKSISSLYIDETLEMYVNHLNSNVFTPAGRRFHSIMTKESIKQGKAFMDSIGFKVELYNDPVFVVGLPRSGTTNLHNMIINEFGYKAFEYWKLASPKRLFENSKMDNVFRKFRSTLGFYIYRYLMPSVQAMHHVNMNTYEECWHFQKNLFLCYNYVIQLKFTEFEEYLHKNDYRFMFEGYKQFMYLNQLDENTHFVLKCPDHLMFTDRIMEVFPNSTIIWIHRHPFESISSYCAMIDSVWKLFMGKTDKKELADYIISLYDRMLKKMMKDRNRLNYNIIDISYRDLINNREDVANFLRTNIKSYYTDDYRLSNPSFYKNKHKSPTYPVSESSMNERFSFYLDQYQQYL